MPPFGPIHRRELIAAYRRLGFDGPTAGGRHEQMTRGTVRVAIPNPHGSVIGRDLLARMVRQAGISRAEWESV